MGKNGIGKSTLLKSLTNLENKQYIKVDGIVKFDNLDLRNCKESQLRAIRKNKIKYVFQDPVLSFDPLKSFDYFIKNSDLNLELLEQKLEVLHLPEISKLRKLFPYELSVGMAQRVSIALSISSEPNILLMDEPTSSVDNYTGNLIKNEIIDFKNHKNNLALILTQDINFAKAISDEISIIKNKKMANFTPNQIFFEQHNTVEEIYSE